MYGRNSAINAGVVVSTAKMHAAFDGRRPQMLVEGPTDSRFWTRYCGRRCVVINCGNKDTVIKSVLALQSSMLKKIVGIVDDDLDRFFGVVNEAHNVMRTDQRDLEATLLESAALENLLCETCDPERIRRFEDSSGISVRAALQSRATVFGELRFIDRRAGFNVDFKQLSPWKYLDRHSWALDRESLYGDFAALAAVSMDTLSQGISSIPPVAPWKIIRGHDAMDILRAGFTYLFDCSIKSEAGIESALRLAYSEELLRSTNLFNDLCVWQVTTSSRIFA